ncbi:nitroreductase family protein [Streptomyces lincolnensis]|uniref:Acg family FMN-binding oxidoreductase n=1 Tax=Streptomyces lincolnensis TaxID=1915 RepID=UPI001E3416BC|nr:nitroreductase family protein [Streptomyces lincolnensis]MCD7442298.1 nitroreductase family protein [Streptomyces lincolnensis]
MSSATLDVAIMEACVAAAVAAPSIYNTQPWTFRLEPDALTCQVRAAPERGLRHVDPDGRALHVSAGACLFNLRVAMAHFGRAPVVRLLPCPGDPDLLAVVRPVARVPGGADAGQADLYESIRRRHSSRLPFSDRPLPPRLPVELEEAARTEGAVLRFPSSAETLRLLRLTAQAEQRNRMDVGRAMESRRWVHQDPYEAADAGLPSALLGPQDTRERLPLRDFTAQRHPERLAARPFEAAPVVALLSTVHDRRTDWLRAGQALERVLLVATAHGLRTSLLHQAMEWPDLRHDVLATPDGGGHAQMLVRLGYGPQGPAGPRRPVRDVIDTGP